MVPALLSCVPGFSRNVEDSCYQVSSPHRTYSYPVTVSTSHTYKAGPWHGGSFLREIYYP
jgi:hypothetical protein